eukprot:g5869.t1
MKVDRQQKANLSIICAEKDEATGETTLNKYNIRVKTPAFADALFHGFWSSPPPPLYTATTPFAEMAAGAVSDEYGVGHAGAKASFFGFSSKMRL